MTDYRLVPVEPTPEMVEAAEDAYMPFGDMEMAIRMALLAAPAVQGELVAITDADILAIAGRVESCPVSPWWLKDDVAIGDVRAAVLRFARALLVAAPQPAEQQPDTTQPVEHQFPSSYPVSGNVYFRDSTGEWVLEITASINGTRCTARHVQPAGTRPEDVVGLPALYESTPDITQLVEALARCRHEASYSIGGGDALSIQLGKVRDIVNQTLSALAAYRKGGEV